MILGVVAIGAVQVLLLVALLFLVDGIYDLLKRIEEKLPPTPVAGRGPGEQRGGATTPSVASAGAGDPRRETEDA